MYRNIRLSATYAAVTVYATVSTPSYHHRYLVYSSDKHYIATYQVYIGTRVLEPSERGGEEATTAMKKATHRRTIRRLQQ